MEYTHNMKIAAYVADCIGDSLKETAIVIDTDKNKAFIIRNGSGGLLDTGDEFGFSKESFYERAATKLLNNTAAAATLAAVCNKEKKSFRNLIRNGMDSGTDKTIGIMDGIDGVSCLELIKLYDDEYAEEVGAMVKNALRSAGDEALIIPVGICSGFFPLGYTIREIISPMPMLETAPGLVMNESLCITSDDAEARGDAVLTKLEKERRSVAHNVTMELLRATDNGCKPYIHVLASKGKYFSDYETAVYSPAVMAIRDEPLVIFSDDKEYKITVPEGVFGRDRPCEFIKLAFIRDNDGLSMLIKCGENEERIQIDDSIYKEVENNE